MVFAMSCGMRFQPLLRIPRLGYAMERAPGAMSSHDFPLAWSTSNAMTKSRSSPWPMVGDGLATGDRESDAPGTTPGPDTLMANHKRGRPKNR